MLALHVQSGVAVKWIHHSCVVAIRTVTVPHFDPFVITRQTLYFMRDTEAIRNLKSILRGILRIITDDDRAFIGTFVGTDNNLNILLVNTEEFRLGANENPVGRYVGQVMVPWRLIRNIELQVASESNAGGYAEQVRVIRCSSQVVLS